MGFAYVSFRDIPDTFTNVRQVIRSRHSPGAPPHYHGSSKRLLFRSDICMPQQVGAEPATFRLFQAEASFMVRISELPTYENYRVANPKVNDKNDVSPLFVIGYRYR